MPTTFTKGDIFQTEGLQAYAQGCNCAGKMDTGVAVAFKKRWPEMFEDYHARCEDGRFQLGDVLVWTRGDQTVFNLGIQQNWKTRASLAALTRALRQMVTLAAAAGISRIGLPRIASGLGGLDWRRVKDVLTKVGEESEIELVVFEQFIRAKQEA